MQFKVNSWHDTLIEFLKCSNEDERVVELFQQHILPEIINQFACKSLNWLEVGPGDGNKTLNIARAIKRVNKFANINLTLCEPSIDWLVTLQNIHIDQYLSSSDTLNYIHKSIEDYFYKAAQQHYHLISLVQVMYNSNIKGAVLSYIQQKPENKKCLIWIDVEDNSGDFYKIRQLLMDEGIQVVHSQGDELVNDLKNKNIQFRTFFTSNKICNIDIHDAMSNEKYWLFPFIIGCDEISYGNLHINIKNSIVNTVRKYIANLGTHVLNIPDISILIYA